MGVIKRQGIKNTIATYLGVLIGFVNLLVVQPQLLSKEELGLTRLLFSFSLVVSTLVPLGIGNATTRFFPLFRNEQKRHHGYFGFTWIFLLAGFALASLSMLVFKGPISTLYSKESPLFNDYFSAVFPLVFFLAAVAIMGIYCAANYKSTIPTYLNDIVVRVLTIAVVVLYSFNVFGLDGFIAAFVGVYAVQFFALLAYIFWFDKPGFRIDWSYFRQQHFGQLVRYGFLLWFAAAASIGLKYFDTIMIGQYMPLRFAGIYAVAAFIPTIIEAPLNAFDRIAASRIAFAWKEKDMNDISSIYRKSSLYMFMIGGLLFLLVNLNIHDLFTFLPEGYSEGASVVVIISTGSLFNMATGLNAAVLFTSERYRFGAVLLILLALLLLVLQVMLIPLYGMNGAALATSLASFFYNGLLFLYVKKHFGLNPFERENTILLGLILALFAAGWFLPSTGMSVVNIAYKSVLIAVVYIGVAYTKNLAPEVFELLQRFRRK